MWGIEYRPKNFDEFFGNKDVIKRIKEYLKLRKLPRVMIFYGDSGCGKTTLAKIIGSILNAEVLEFNVANTRGIDTVREIIEVSKYMPFGFEKRVFIFDEAHRITKDGQEAMLKLLEENDIFNHFIFCTTDIEGLIETIRNRAKVFGFKGLDYEEMTALVKWLEKKSGKKWTDEIVMKVWRMCRGIPRLVVNTLEEVDSEEDIDNVFNKIFFSEVGDDVAEIARAMKDGVLSWKVFQSRIKNKNERELLNMFESLKTYFVKMLLNAEDKKWMWYLVILKELSKGRDLANYLIAVGKIIAECNNERRA